MNQIFEHTWGEVWIQKSYTVRKSKAVNLDGDKTVFKHKKHYGIIWGKYTLGIQSFLKRNEDFPSKSKQFDLLWLIQ